MCGEMVTRCGMQGTSQSAVHLRARAGHMNNTNAHTTIHNPHGITGVRSSTIANHLQIYYQWVVYANQNMGGLWALPTNICLDILPTLDVAVGQHRDIHGLLDDRHLIQMCRAVSAMCGRAPVACMDGDEAGAGGRQLLHQLQRGLKTNWL